MQEVELTAQRLLSVWWLMVWRGTVGGIILGAIAGALAGLTVAIMRRPELASVAGSFAGFAVMPFWGLLIVHMGLKKKYRSFRIVLVLPATAT
jgi:hypothetical protein